MIVRSATGNPAEADLDAIVVGIGEDWKSSRVFQLLDAAMGASLSRLMESEEVSTKPMKVTSILIPTGLRARQLVLVGLGPIENRDAGAGFRAAATASKLVASSKHRKRVGFAGFEGDPLFIQSSVVGSITGCVGQDLFRSERSLHAFEQVEWFDVSETTVNAAKIVGESVN